MNPRVLVAVLIYAAMLVAGVLIALPVRAQPVDVALVLGVDVSGSVSTENFNLQRDGVAEAVGSDDFAVAVRSGQIGRIALMVIQWGSEARVAINWRVIETQGQALAFAAEVRAMERTESGATCLSNALIKAGAALMAWEDNASRRVIDVSGDGADNCNIDVADARAAILAQGITINGLPIVTTAEPMIAEWYERKLIGGPGAFLIVAEGFKSFADAIRKKIATEVAEVRP